MKKNDVFSISVIIPTYNRGSLLEESVKSVLNQSLRPCSVIVVDDGSSTPINLDQFKEDKSLKIIRQKNAGQQRARNHGVERAKTEWVALLDDDDLWDEDFLENTFRAIQANPDCSLVFSNFRQLFPAGILGPDKFSQAPDGFWNNATKETTAYKYFSSFPAERSLRFQPFFPSGLVIRKELYERSGGFDPKLRGIKGEDFDFIFRALRIAKLMILTHPYVKIRRHGQNDSANSLDMTLGEFEVLKIISAKHQDDATLQHPIQQALSDQRLRAIDAAYWLYDFKRVKELSREHGWNKLPAKHKIRVLISLLPTFLSKAIAVFLSRKP